MPIGTEFKVKYKSGHIEPCNVKLIYRNATKCFEWSDGDDLRTYDTIINATFIPIYQPVSFMEVLNSNKKCRLEYKEYRIKTEFTTLDYILQTIASCTNCDLQIVMRDGEWYLEE